MVISQQLAINTMFSRNLSMTWLFACIESIYGFKDSLYCHILVKLHGFKLGRWIFGFGRNRAC